MKRLSIILAVLLLGVNSLRAQSETSPITVTTEVDKVRMTIGDLVTYSVVVSHDPDLEVEMPGLGANLGGFHIRDYELHDPKKEKGRLVKQADYTISTFVTGTFDIPPIQVFYKHKEDSIYQVLLTESIQIEVASVQEGEGQPELVDIKPPVGLPYDAKRLIFFIGMGLLVVALVVAAVLIHRHRKAGGTLLPKTPPKPPHEIAMEALERLAASSLLSEGRIKEYYIEISEIVRGYIEGRYYVQALEMATWEIMQALKGSDISQDHRALVNTFLEQCDLVKFAKVIPGDDVHSRVMEEARRLVMETRVLLMPAVSEEAETEAAVAEEAAGPVKNEEAGS